MTPDGDPPGRPTPWERFVGDLDRIGWWSLPAFLAVGLAGAVMAGALAVVYYSQQVSDLESETRAARQDLQAGVEEVQRARDEALEEIADQVDAVRDALDEAPPVEDPATLGLVVVEARVHTPPPPSATVAPEPPPPAGGETPAGAPAVLAQDGQTESPPDDADPTPPQEEQPTDEPEPEPEPEPPPVQPRLGVGFTVAVEGAVTFVATSYGLVADPDARAGVVEEVVVTSLDGQRASGTVHSWDESRGLALLRVELGALPIPDWRPRADVVEPRDPLTVMGLTPDRDPVAVRGHVVRADVEKVVTDLPLVEFLRGAPVVDRTGRVVAVYTPEYLPWGPAAGRPQALAPVGLFCERMLNGCETLEAEATEPTDE